MNSIIQSETFSVPGKHKQQESQDEEIQAEKPKPMKLTNTVFEGKHLAKRGIKEWVPYGNPEIFNTMFEEGVLKAASGVIEKKWNAPKLVEFCESWRSEIEGKRGYEGHELFGLRRESALKKKPRLYDPGWTSMSCPAYRYAIDRAVSLEYESDKFIAEQSQAGKKWEEKYFRKNGGRGCLRYGLIQGKIGSEKIPLTQYIFCDLPRFENDSYFGRAECFKGKNRESAVWVHPDKIHTEKVMKHINSLIDKGLEGDLSVIPAIHWWYVQLAPVVRGPGGIAEMIINTLCRLQGLDLPEWNDGIAPSVEVLLEPCIDRFSQKYHQLFKDDSNNLQNAFGRR